MTRLKYTVEQGREWFGNKFLPVDKFYVQSKAGPILHGLTQAEAQMAVEFLNSCDDAVYQIVQNRLLWSTLDGFSKLMDAPFVEGGITIHHVSQLELAVEDGRIVVRSFNEFKWTKPTPNEHE